jgi:hypothetical protein
VKGTSIRGYPFNLVESRRTWVKDNQGWTVEMVDDS